MLTLLFYLNKYLIYYIHGEESILIIFIKIVMYFHSNFIHISWITYLVTFFLSLPLLSISKLDNLKYTSFGAVICITLFVFISIYLGIIQLIDEVMKLLSTLSCSHFSILSFLQVEVKLLLPLLYSHLLYAFMLIFLKW